MLQSVALYMCLCIGLTMEAPICRPTIKEGQIGTPEIGGFISLECEIATCNKPAKIVFEKAGLNETWMPVFEGISTTQYKALDTVTEYTLENRNYYYAFRTSVHSLHIVPLILKDHGKWRCVLYDVTGKGYDSRPLNVTVYVPPDVDNFYISPNKSHLLFHQTQEFTCVADGIHPKPNVLWKMNGVEHKGIADGQQRTNQLWVVTNTIRLNFDTLGVNTLSCVLNANARVTWMECNIDITVQAPICTPTLTEGQVKKLEIGGFISLECDISTCTNITKIVFEKADINETWTPMFEGVHKAYQNAVDTASEHNTQGRHYYNPLRTSVKSLHIIPLLLRDYGKWRCVVDDVTGKEYTSRPLYVNVYVRPATKNFYISPNNSYLVVDQTQEFTCLVGGINPEPDVFWEVNSDEYTGNTTTKQRDDYLWDVRDSIRVTMDTPGINIVKCVIRTKDGDPWLMNHINITVQEPAIVLHPQRDQTQTVDVYSTFTLSCGGSGYNASITWKRNSEIILTNDTRYIIMDDCVNSKCDGSIKSKPMDPILACKGKEHYSGLYTCAITLEPPYISSAVSSNISVTISKTQCKEIPITRTFIISSLSVMSVVLIAPSIVCLVRRRQKKKRRALLREETAELIDKYLDTLNSIPTAYEIKNWLHLCSQIRDYDTVVLFDYGSNSVFIHALSDLQHYKHYTHNIKFHAMIRISGNMFLATEHESHDIHLLQLRDETFDTKDTIILDKSKRRTLVCSANENSFIKCDFSGEDELHEGTVYRICVTDYELKSQLLPFKPFEVRNEPLLMSLKKKNTQLVIITQSGVMYTLDLENYKIAKDEKFVNFVDGVVQSMYIDIHDNVIVGDRGGNIHIYTPTQLHRVKQKLHEPVRGITVTGGRMIVCSGTLQQYIEVLETIEGERAITFEKEIDHVTPTYTTTTCLKICAQSHSYNHVVLFDFLSKRVFKYDVSALTKHIEYTCHINIHDMIRISDDSFVVTEPDTYTIHLLHLRDGQLDTRDTFTHERNHKRTLICAENDNSFIMGEFHGDNELHEGIIYRMTISNGKLKQQLLTPKPFTVNCNPWIMSLNSNLTKLVIVSHRGSIYTGDLENYSPIPDESVVHYIDGVVHSLYIDKHNNIMIGDRSGKIHMYTPDKQLFVVQDVNEHVRGITVIEGDRMIVCHGKWGEKQQINIFSFKQLHQ